MDKLKQFFLSVNNFCPYYSSPQSYTLVPVLRSSISADSISVISSTFHTLTAEIGDRPSMASNCFHEFIQRSAVMLASVVKEIGLGGLNEPVLQLETALLKKARRDFKEFRVRLSHFGVVR